MKSRLYRWVCWVVVVVLICAVVVGGSVQALAAGKYIDKGTAASQLPEMTELAKYAFSWADHTNVRYVYGGGRSGQTLEDLDKDATDGTDCSGFVGLVYTHFGLQFCNGTWNDAGIKAYGTEIDASEAVPGDVLWWDGHVGIYLGNGKMIHTNTKEPPYNFPHVSDVSYRSTAPVYLRLVDDVSKLGGMSSADASQTVSDIQSSNVINYVVTESDITGLPIEETVREYQKQLQLGSDLTSSQTQVVADIRSNMYDGDYDWIDWVRKGVSFVGIFLIFYGVLLCIVYIVDYYNCVFQISLLYLVSVFTYKVADDDRYLSYKEEGKSHVKYLTPKMLIKRVAIIEIIGFILVSGFVYRILYFIYRKYKNLT